MKKLILFLLFCSTFCYSQYDFSSKNNSSSQKLYTTETELKKEIQPFNVTSKKSFTGFSTYQSYNVTGNNTQLKWSYTDPVSIGQFCETSSNGVYSIVGWDLNNQ